MTPVIIQMVSLYMALRSMALMDMTAAMWYLGGGFVLSFGYIFLLSVIENKRNKREMEEARKLYDEDSKIS